jgi:hypothetical protein
MEKIDADLVDYCIDESVMEFLESTQERDASVTAEFIEAEELAKVTFVMSEKWRLLDSGQRCRRELGCDQVITLFSLAMLLTLMGYKLFVKCRCYIYMDETFTLQLARTSDM